MEPMVQSGRGVGLLVALLLGACGPAAEAPSAGVHILAPAEGAALGDTVEVVLHAQGVRIAPATGTPVPGEAHHHLFLDADLPQDLAVPVGQGEGIVHLGAGDTTFAFTGVPAGSHRLIALLARGDHVPVAGAVADTVWFSVR